MFDKLTIEEQLSGALGTAWVLIGVWLYLFDPNVAGRYSVLIATFVPVIALAFYFTYRRRRTRDK